jgi:hypothetical protein
MRINCPMSLHKRFGRSISEEILLAVGEDFTFLRGGALKRRKMAVDRRNAKTITEMTGRQHGQTSGRISLLSQI